MHSSPLESTKVEEEDEDYMNDDKSSDNYEDYDSDDKNDHAASSTTNDASTTEEPYITKEYVEKGEAGKSVTLKCHGENFDSATIFMWYNNSRLVIQGKSKPSEDPRIEFSHKDGSLTIKDINSYDDGSYRCRAYPSKQRYETLVELHVDGAPSGVSISEHKEKNVDISGTTLNFRAGKRDLKFKCSVAKSRPSAKIDWIHNGNTILESQGKDHDLKIEDDVLIIKNVHARHAGEYQCEASNEFGTLKSTFNLEVECKFKIPRTRFLNVLNFICFF